MTTNVGQEVGKIESLFTLVTIVATMKISGRNLKTNKQTENETFL